MLWCISGTLTPIEMIATGNKNIQSFRSRQVRLAMGNFMPKIVTCKCECVPVNVALKGPYCKLSTYNAFQRHADGDV